MATCNTIDNDITMSGASGTLLAGRYRIVKQLGQGGMGSVWLAEDTQLDNKPFAIKMLPSILVSNKRAYRQLKDEALVAMKLTHPNIVPLRAFEENNGNPFLVMDYIDGQTLDDYLSDYSSRVEHVERVGQDGDRARLPSAPQSGGLPEEEVIRILKPIAAALDYAHSKGVVHRDVKPGNVMIAKDGTPYILDFGIAREMQETMTRVTGKLSSGTLLYMSPEQLNGDAPKKEQDIYSFAAMVYECLKGEPPFVRGAIEDQIKNKVPEPPVDCGASATPLVAGIMSGLAKKPEDRPPTCAAVLSGDVSRVEHAESDRGGARRKGAIVKVLVRVVIVLALIGVIGLGILCVADWIGRPSRKDAIQSIIVNMVDIPGKSFKMGRFKVTQAQWQAIMGENPSKFKYWFKWNNPVERVSWSDCKEFLCRLNATTQAAESGLTFRLPTEEEWEYAYKAGGTVTGGTVTNEMIIGRASVIESRLTQGTYAVGRYRCSNAFGLDDMTGNVWEWCEDKYDVSGDYRVLRGGYGIVSAHSCSYLCVYRDGGYLGRRYDYCGLRLCCSVEDVVPSKLVAKDAASVAPAASSASQKTGDKKTLALPGGATMEMIYVAPGEFMMGSDDGGTDEQPVHKVRLTNGFWLGKYEVTQKQWQSVMRGNPSYWKGDDLPVELVSWNACQEFAKKVNAQLNCGARLPTEAEWEYACRAGTTGAYAWRSREDIGWYYGNSGNKTHKVGQKQPNAWGFHDMHGNVLEWCEDWYGSAWYSESPAIDPMGPASGVYRVLRGGDWFDDAWFCSPTSRASGDPGDRRNCCGFRLCCSAGPRE